MNKSAIKQDLIHQTKNQGEIGGLEKSKQSLNRDHVPEPNLKVLARTRTAQNWKKVPARTNWLKPEPKIKVVSS